MRKPTLLLAVLALLTLGLTTLRAATNSVGPLVNTQIATPPLPSAIPSPSNVPLPSDIPLPSDTPLPSGEPLPSTGPITVTLDPYAIVWDDGLITLPQQLLAANVLASPVANAQPARSPLPQGEATPPPPDPDSIYGPTDDRQPITDSTQFPYRAIVRITYKNPNGAESLCTGFLYDTNTVATAAHCMYNRGDPNRGPDGWVSDVVVTPGLNNGNTGGFSKTPYAACRATRKTAPAGWINNGDLAYDFSTIKLASDCPSNGAVLGTFKISNVIVTDQELNNQISVSLIGYPGDKRVNGDGGDVLVMVFRRCYHRWCF